MSILVTGATGNTGSRIVQLLAAAGEPVRAMVRSESAAHRLPAGASFCVADFDAPESIAAALASVTRVYLVTPSSERAEQQQLAFVEAAARHGVERVVLLSQYAAQLDSPVRFLRYHAVVEQRLREIGVGYTILRPNLYFQGLLALADQIARTSVLAAPIGDATVSAVDVRDIAEVAVEALTGGDQHAGATYTLTGPTAITHAQMAEGLSAATGSSIGFVSLSDEQFASAASGFLPAWQLDGLLEDYAHYRRGEAADVSQDVPRITGHPARSFAAFAHDYADAFIGGNHS